MNTKHDKLKLMKKFLPAIFFAILLFPFSTLSSQAGCSPITTAGCASGSYCSASNLCCTAASDCSVPLTNTPTVAEDAACSAAGITPETCAAINTLFTSQPDGPWYSQNPSQFSAKVLGGDQSEIFGERYTYAQINWIINSIATMLNPAANIHSATDLINFINAIKSVLHASRPTIQDYAKLGPAGLFAGGISALYSNPPASGVGEIKTLASKIFDLGTGTQPAYAQAGGYGFNGLGGNTGGAVRALWTASRNMAYLIMIILLIASGFLIMFRVKINPQTVVSLQTMIPKLIITMLLVTFSFAIAGLVIDLIYVIIAAFVGMLSINQQILSVSNVPDTINNLVNRSFFPTYAAYQMVAPVVFGLIFTAILAVVGMATIWFTVGLGSAAVAGGGIIFAIIMIIILIVYFITLWKIFWMLLKSYVMILLQITIAPLQIMLDLIPGQQGFGPWLRNFISNASVFVVVPIMLALQTLLSGDWFTNLFFHFNTNYGSAGGSSLNLPFLGGGLPSLLIPMATGFVIFTLTPKIADMIRDALKIPAFKYGGAIGEALSPAGWGYGLLSRNQADNRKVEMERAAKELRWDDYRKLVGQERMDETVKSGLKQLGGIK